jgi:hypothetical protein
VQGRHLHEPAVADAVDGVLDDLERGAGGRYSEPFLDRSTGVGRTNGQPVAVEEQLLDLPVQVRNGIDVLILNSSIPSNRCALSAAT